MEQVIQEIITINPPFFEKPLGIIKHHFETKHWYELGENLIDLLSQPGIVGEKISFYEKFISLFTRNLNPFHCAQIIYLTSQDFSSPQDSLTFLEDSKKLFQKDPEAHDWISLQMISHYIIDGEFEKALSQTVEIGKNIKDSSSMFLRSLYYKVQSTLDKARGDYDAFYEHAMMYLSTSRQYKDVVLAYDLCSAALISQSVCSFGELAEHPIVKTLESSENKWMFNLIKLLDDGSPLIIDEFKERYLPIIEAKPRFSKFVENIKFKVSLSVLMQLIFQRPFESRVFKFDEITFVCKIPKSQVELLVLKAFSAKIIEGYIDEVEEKIFITWCKPKSLGIMRLHHLKDEIDRWIEKIHEQQVKLAQKTQDVVG
ncbi:26S proteasome non-ATPase regulatory subunit 13 [Tritrichomonas foetus]|uniref:26S proteasome non-ATPase regulatory subunit 13 n=1 Tax=Tritrichomonas foetus TaxID=1144522 RepID=A0A1J4KRW9_9EUKA|nr:26S proteasome non-ATPase regulatory subunit 13 [Tritrichomonas foetus]|eukprot:OHT13842.1 26S proteasome non-ATPase regulatory subunit 13 [Tritrichomonas foetus]